MPTFSLMTLVLTALVCTIAGAVLHAQIETWAKRVWDKIRAKIHNAGQ